MTAFTGRELGKYFVTEGIVPPNSYNVEVHIPVNGALFIRCDIFVTNEDIPKIQRALGALVAENAKA